MRTGGRPRALDPEQEAALAAARAKGVSVEHVANALGVSHRTVYRRQGQRVTGTADAPRCCGIAYTTDRTCPHPVQFEIRYMTGVRPVIEGACGPVHLGRRIWQVEQGQGKPGGAMQFEVRTVASG